MQLSTLRFSLPPQLCCPPHQLELPATCVRCPQVARLRGVAVEPAVLESTQLMLAHGLDLFYNRLTPSK